jgi:hypothetical protein
MSRLKGDHQPFLRVTNMTGEHTAARWTSAWPDALAFALGLGVAKFAGWTTTDLVWSLWLSSLVVGFTMIVWGIVRPAVDIARAAWQHRAFAARARSPFNATTVAAGAILLLGGLFALAFFTLHFGGFHYVHSQFLSTFFPLDGRAAGQAGMAGVDTYLEVVRRYWQFLPSAFLAERAAFMRQAPPFEEDLSVTVAAIAARKAANAEKGRMMFAPYRNVMRMHVLIFFFAFAHLAGVETFAVFTVVYAAYFFPWRLLSKGAQGAQSTQSV